MSNVFGWLGYREQKGILSDVQNHMKKVKETVALLRPVLEALYADRIDEANQWHEQLAATEHEADVIRRDIMSKLYHGILLPPERQDLVRLLGSMDDVADQAEGAARIAVVFESAPAYGDEDMLFFTDLIGQAVDQLTYALEMLSTGKSEKTLEACTKIELLEEEGDRLKHRLLKGLFAGDLPSQMLLLLYLLTESLENTIDRAEDCADLIRVLSFSHKR